MNSLENLQKDLCRKITSLIEDIITLNVLSGNRTGLDLTKEIEKLKVEKNTLINTQAYLKKCDKELMVKLEEWLKNGCKGEIQILLTGGE